MPGTEDQHQAPAPAESVKADVKAGEHKGRRRRGRRGGRGRRRPSPGGPQAPEGIGKSEPAAAAEPSTEITQAEDVGSSRERDRPARPSESRQPFRPADASAISQAIDEVMQIVDALKVAHEKMEEVLELVELAERQKLADERELDSLRRAMRQLHRPRDRRNDEGDEKHSS